MPTFKFIEVGISKQLQGRVLTAGKCWKKSRDGGPAPWSDYAWNKSDCPVVGSWYERHWLLRG